MTQTSCWSLKLVFFTLVCGDTDFVILIRFEISTTIENIIQYFKLSLLTYIILIICCFSIIFNNDSLKNHKMASTNFMLTKYKHFHKLTFILSI